MVRRTAPTTGRGTADKGDMPHSVPPSRRAQRVLERLGLRVRIVVERPDGSPPTDADVEAVRHALAEFDDLESRADRAVSLAGASRADG